MILGLVATLAQLADLATARIEIEVNPLAAELLTMPLGAFAAKTALVALVCAVAAIAARRHRIMPRIVLLVATIAGVVGFVSNGGVS